MVYIIGVDVTWCREDRVRQDEIELNVARREKYLLKPSRCANAAFKAVSYNSDWLIGEPFFFFLVSGVSWTGFSQCSIHLKLHYVSRSLKGSLICPCSRSTLTRGLWSLTGISSAHHLSRGILLALHCTSLHSSSWTHGFSYFNMQTEPRQDGPVTDKNCLLDRFKKITLLLLNYYFLNVEFSHHCPSSVY